MTARHSWDEANLTIKWREWTAKEKAKRELKLARMRARRKAQYEKGRPAREQAALNRRLEKLMRWG